MKAQNKPKSIRKRFTYGLAAVVGGIFIAFSVCLIVYSGKSLERELNTRLENLTGLSVNGLSSALWQYNYEYVNDYLASLFQYEDLVFASVHAESEVISRKMRPGFPEETDAAYFGSSDRYLAKQAEIKHHGVVIGNIHLAMSRERIDKLTITNSLLAILLLSLIISGIFITTFVLSRKHVFAPLARLEASALAISDGRLDTRIDTSSADEIGRLARTLSQMINTLKTTMASRDELEAEVAERKRMETELRSREQLLNEMGRIAKIGGWEHDLITRKATWTEETYRIIEIESGDIPGPDEHLDHYPPADRAVLEKVYRRATETGEPFDLELQCTTAKGRLIWARAIGHPEFKNGRCIKMKGTFQDITDLKRMEENLRQAQKMESIGNLAGGIAHDFNNILSSIIGFTELALDDVERGSALEDNLREIYVAGKRARDLIQQILTFARQTSEEVKPVQVSKIAHESLKLLRASIPSTIRIRQRFESDSVVMGNPTQLQQVIMNLCTNAAQAMEQSGAGELTVALDTVDIDGLQAKAHQLNKTGPYLKMTVSDTGVGIDPMILDSIFEPYFTTKKQGSGTGMGLATVHGIVKKYGGDIWVESKPGDGSRFTVLLPVAQQRRGRTRYAAEESTKMGNERILIVDDEAPIAKMTSKMLERLGYVTTTRTSSLEALALFKARPDDFDLLITDTTMPNMTGDRLAEEMMKIRPDLPVILCSGYSQKVTDADWRNIGIKAFAYKPIVKADLANTVRKVLDEAKDSARTG